jgi:arabinofuranan 3-O-arabinosyltransferase
MSYELWLIWRFVANRWTRYVASWLLALGLAAHLQHMAWHTFDKVKGKPSETRRDGNEGHTTIDFGGQWLMGRMLVLGHGRELYNLNRHYEVLQAAFPYEDESNDPDRKHDADDLLGAFMDTEDPTSRRIKVEGEGLLKKTRATKQTLAAPLMAADPLQAAVIVAVCEHQFWTPAALEELKKKHVGGPLYPPIHAFLMAPLALNNDVRGSYRLMQWIVLGMGFLGGLGVSVLTRGRVWWPVASTLIMLFPGFKGAHDLAQNSAVTLAIVIWGWALVARDRPMLGGMILGLLAFKPTWAMAFFLVPLLTRRWRTCAAMIATGIVLAAITLPFVGIQSWLDWLKVGQVANFVYDVDGNWIPLSRDLFGLGRRLLIDTSDNTMYYDRDRWEAHVIGWALWLFVFEATLKLSQYFRARFTNVSGPAPALLFIAAWLLCLHFMYYDALIAAAGVLLLLDPPARLFTPLLITFRKPAEPNPDPDPDYFLPRLADTHPDLEGRGVRGAMVANSFVMYAFACLFFIQHTLPWLDLGATLSLGRLFPERAVSSMGEAVVKDGKTVMHKPSVEILLSGKNPPLETYFLLFLWAWCAVRVLLPREEWRQSPAKKPP